MAVLPQCLIGQVGQKPSADGFCRCMKYPPGQAEILLRRSCQKIPDQFTVMAAGIGAGLQQTSDVQKQNFCLFRSRHIDHQGFPGNTGIGFRKNLSRTNAVQKAPVSPEIVIFNMHVSRQNNPERLHHIPHVINHTAFFKASYITAKACQHFFDFRFGHPSKQNCIFQKMCFHLFSFCCYNNILIGMILLYCTHKVKIIPKGGY